MLKRLMRAMFAVMALAALGIAAPTASAQGKPGETAAAVSTELAETRWAGRATWADGEWNDWTLYFRSDGVLIYGYAGQTFDNGRWRQREIMMNFDTNNYFALYVGHVNGNVIEGQMFNIRGNTGSFRFTRQ